MNDFKEIRNNLLSMLEDLDEQLSGISSDVNQTDEFVIKAFEDEVSDTFETTNIQGIEKIKQAISSIDSGTYGICLTCGTAIKKQQLNKNHFSKQCKYCTEKKNDS